jgi:hypothetical protein
VKREDVKALMDFSPLHNDIGSVREQMRAELPRLDSDRLAWFNGQKVYLEIGKWCITSDERGWCVGHEDKAKVRYEATFKEALDAAMDDLELDEYADGSVHWSDRVREPDLEDE